MSGIASSTFAGRLELSAAYDDALGDVGFDLAADVTFPLGAWALLAELCIESGVWEDLALTASLECDLAEIESTLRIEPDRVRFKDWKTSFEFAFGATDLGLVWKLTRSSRWFTLEAESGNPSIDLEGRVRLRATKCDALAFHDARLEVEAPIACAELDLTAEITDDGFDEASLEIADLSIPPFPWIELDVEAEITVVGASWEIDPSFEVHACEGFDIEVSADSGDGLGSLNVTRIGVEWEIPSVTMEVQLLPDTEEWIDDRYAMSAHLELKGSSETAPGLDALEARILWLGDDSDVWADRFAVTADIELDADLFLHLSVDTAVPPTMSAQLSVGFEIAW